MLWDLRFSQQWLWKLLSSSMWLYVVYHKCTDISEEPAASGSFLLFKPVMYVKTQIKISIMKKIRADEMGECLLKFS
jgi:hypothetical protein